MIYNVNELRKDTVVLIRTIDAQIDEVEGEARIAGVPANKLKDSNGNWVLSPLLLAKAMAYNTLVMLQSSGTASAGPGAHPVSRH